MLPFIIPSPISETEIIPSLVGLSKPKAFQYCPEFSIMFLFRSRSIFARSIEELISFYNFNKSSLNSWVACLLPLCLTSIFNTPNRISSELILSDGVVTAHLHLNSGNGI